MGNPLFGVAPFLLVCGAVLLVFFGLRGVGLLRSLLRRSRWEHVPAEVLELSLRQGRGTGANRGRGVRHVTTLQSEDVWTVRYRYAAGGGRHEGTSRCLEMPPPAQGSTVTVLVDPRRPQRSEWFDDRASVLSRVIGRGIGTALGAVLIALAVAALVRGG